MAATTQISTAGERMRHDWEARAHENARFYICTDVPQSDAEFFASGEEDYNRFVRPFLTRHSFHSADHSALEIGCGIGRMTHVFAREFARVTGVDISAEMIAKAWAAGIPRAEFIHGTGVDLTGVADASVDFAFSYIVFQHIPDTRVTLNYFSEIGRVLRPGGLFLVHVNGLPYVRLGSLVMEGYVSRSPKLRRVGLSRLPFVRRRSADTWMGHPVSLTQLRPVLASAGLSLQEVNGRWTPEMWVAGRKSS